MVTKKMTWTGGIRFAGVGTYGNGIVTDGSKKAGGGEEGYNPAELLLFGMAGCAGVDIVRILEKQRQELTSLEIEVTGHQNDDYPRPFHTIEVKFVARGKDLDPKKLAKAIELSESKYCVVGQTIRNHTEVITSYEVVPEHQFRVLAVHNVQKTLAEKGFEHGPLKIIEVCNARFAYQALSKQVDVALFMPCRYVVYIKEQKTVVKLARPSLIARMLPVDELGDLATDVEQVLKKIMQESV